MQAFNNSHSRKRKSGFTLVELMVVIMIISILSGVVLTAMNRSDDSMSIDAAVTRLDSLFSLARSAAITRKQPTRVLISFESGNNQDLDKYHPALRYITIVYLDDDGAWKVYSNPEFLPGGIYFSPALSSKTGQNPALYTWKVTIDPNSLNVSNPDADLLPVQPYSISNDMDQVRNAGGGPGTGKWFAFEFNPNGTFHNPGARVVVTPGILELVSGEIAILIDSAEDADAADSAKGFVVFRSGKVHHFQSADQIKEGQ